MSKSIAITRARDYVPARRCLLLAVMSIVVLGAAADADARSRTKPVALRPPAVTTPVTPANGTIDTATSAGLHGTNGSTTSRPPLEAPTGSILGVTVGKAPTAATADVVVEPSPSASPQRLKDRYPESHSYLRPYHYKWRYWTPAEVHKALPPV